MHSQTNSPAQPDHAAGPVSQRWLIYFCILAAVESAACVVCLMSMPADPKNVIFLGYSARRLAVIGGVFLLAVLFTWLAWWFRLRQGAAVQRSETFCDWFQQRQKILHLCLIAAAILFTGAWIVSWTPPYRFHPYDLIYKGLRPVVVLGTALSLEAAIWLLLVGYGFDWEKVKAALRQQRDLVRSILIIFTALLLAWGFVALTGFGMTPDVTFWNTAGSPLLSPLALVGWVLCAILLILAQALPGRARIASGEKPSAIHLIQRWGRKADWIICGCIFILAAILWLMQPVQPTFFAPGPSEPNNALYPYSDAAGYDIAAQYALIGQEMNNGDHVDKPLYSTFLFILHLFAGQNYPLLTALQTIAFAIIPVLIYLILRQIADRVSALLAALLVTFKIATSIISATAILSANPRLLISEMPTAIGLLFFTLWMILWWKAPEKGWVYLALTGGTIGMLTLVRHNAWILLPFAMLILVVIYRKRIRLAALANLVLLAALLVSIAPWMLRTYYAIGTPWYFLGSLRSVVWTDRYGIEEVVDEILPTEQPAQSPTQPTAAQPTPSTVTENCADPATLAVNDLGAFDDSSKYLAYCGDWQVVEQSKAYKSTLHVSSTAGDRVALKFKGNTLVLVYASAEDSGKLDIEIDGKRVEQLDTSRAGEPTWKVKWVSPTLDLLGSQEHLLVVTHAGDGAVSLDRIVAGQTGFAKIYQSVAGRISSALSFVPRHFIHNLFTSFMVLPSSLQNDDINHLVEDTFWESTWDGRISVSQALLYGIDLLLVSAGLAYTWKRCRLVGWLPLVVFLVYNLGTAAARTSGGRYISPIDWVVVVYYAAGLFHLTAWAAVPLGFRLDDLFDEPAPESTPQTPLTFRAGLRPVALVMLGLLLVGVSPTFSEKILPRTYRELSSVDRVELLQEYNLASLLGVSETELIEFASQPNVILTRGKALYPRYYYMNKGEPSKKGVYRIMAFPRLAFTLIGPDGTFASVLPAAGIESYPSDFPQAAETILLGCNSGEDTSALAVIVDDGSAEPVVYLRTPPAVALQCPLPDPVCQNDQNCE